MDFKNLCSLFEDVTLGTPREFLTDDPKKVAGKINNYIKNNLSSADEKIHISLGNIYLDYVPSTNKFVYTLRQGYKLDLNKFLKSGHALVSQIPPFNFREGTIYNFPKTFSPNNLYKFINMVKEYQKRTAGILDPLVSNFFVTGMDDLGVATKTEWPGRIRRTKKNLADMKSGFGQFYKDTLKPLSTSIKNYFQRK